MKAEVPRLWANWRFLLNFWKLLDYLPVGWMDARSHTPVVDAGRKLTKKP
jgi:hypothetical protein